MRLIDEARDRLRKRERDAARTKPSRKPTNEATAQIRAQVIAATLFPPFQLEDLRTPFHAEKHSFRGFYAAFATFQLMFLNRKLSECFSGAISCRNIFHLFD